MKKKKVTQLILMALKKELKERIEENKELIRCLELIKNFADRKVSNYIDEVLNNKKIVC